MKAVIIPKADNARLVAALRWLLKKAAEQKKGKAA